MIGVTKDFIENISGDRSLTLIGLHLHVQGENQQFDTYIQYMYGVTHVLLTLSF